MNEQSVESLNGDDLVQLRHSTARFIDACVNSMYRPSAKSIMSHCIPVVHVELREKGRSSAQHSVCVNSPQYCKVRFALPFEEYEHYALDRGKVSKQAHLFTVS